MCTDENKKESLKELLQDLEARCSGGTAEAFSDTFILNTESVQFYLTQIRNKLRLAIERLNKVEKALYESDLKYARKLLRDKDL